MVETRMKKRWEKRVAWSFVLAFFAAGCDSAKSPVAPLDPSYPTIVTTIPAADLDMLTDEFRSRYPHVCSDLDEYGHPVRRYGNTALSCRPPAGIDVGAPYDGLVDAAKAAIANMFDFTEVSDPAGLMTRRISVSGGSQFTKSFLTVRFENQRYEGREVLSSQIMAWVDSLGVLSVSGHHFAEIHLPAIRSSGVIARQQIVGLEIPWYDTVGREKIFTVTRDSIDGVPAQAIRPEKVGDTIQLRVAWEFRIRWGDTIGWYVYVDIHTGETLGWTQLFAT